MTYTLDDAARQDLREYLGHIAADNLEAARERAESILAALDGLAANPYLGRRAEIRGLRRPVRCFVFPPLRVYYEPTAGGIHVFRIYHHARRPISSR